MRIAKLVYIKDLDLVFCHKDHSKLMDVLNLTNMFIITCSRLIADLKDSEVEIKATDTNSAELLHITHSGEVKTIVWSDQ